MVTKRPVSMKGPADWVQKGPFVGEGQQVSRSRKLTKRNINDGDLVTWQFRLNDNYSGVPNKSHTHNRRHKGISP